MSIKLMATIGKNFELSSDVKKLWYLPENENRMFYVLHGKDRYILVDYETFMANPEKYNRNVFVYGNKSLENFCDVICYDNIDAICDRFLDSEDSLWVVGSTSKFYKMFLDKVVTMDITKVEGEHIRPFSYFPSIYENQWDIESVEKCENDIIYHNKVYRRIKVR